MLYPSRTSLPFFPSTGASPAGCYHSEADFADGKVTEYPIIAIPRPKLVDTNEAADAYVENLSCGVVQVKSVAHWCAASEYTTSDIVQQSNCTFPPEHVGPSVQGDPDEGVAER